MPTPYQPKDLMGDHVHDMLKGTRLAAHLSEIRDRFGANDQTLKTLAERALRGKMFTDLDSKGDIFTAIRDRLSQHANKQVAGDPSYTQQAKALSTGLNWHRVGDALQMDQLVKGFIDRSVSDNLKGRHLRAAHKLFGKDSWKRPHDPKWADFRNGLWNEVKNQVGMDKSLGLKDEHLSWDKIEASIERLSRMEQYREDLATRNRKRGDNKTLVETRPSVTDRVPAKVDSTDTMNWLAGSGPAYDATKKGIRVRKDTDAEQYELDELVAKYGVMNSLFGKKAVAEPAGPDGIAFKGGAGSAVDPVHPANLERQAVGINLDNLGVTDSRSSDPNERKRAAETAAQYTDAIRDHWQKTFSPSGSSDPHTQQYMNTLSAGGVHTARTLASGLAPLVKKFATEFGHYKSRNPTGSKEEYLPFAEEVDAPEPTVDLSDSSTSDEPAPAPTPTKKVKSKVAVDPVAEAALKRTATDETLPISSPSKVTTESGKKVSSLLSLAAKLKARSAAMETLVGLEAEGVPESEWAARIVSRGKLDKRTAASLINQMKKMKPEAKKAILEKKQPLRFARAMNELLRAI